MTDGVFITIEGIEGSGKSTHVRFLADYLRGLDLPVTETREPGGTEIGEVIRRLLLCSGDKEISPETELFLMLACRADHVERVIRPAIERGEVVLCDRYADATVAYQGFGRGLELDRIRELNETATCGVSPDITVLLDVDVKTGLSRAAARSPDGKADRFERENVDFHERVREGYKHVASREPDRVNVVNADDEIEVVRENIRRIVAEFWRKTVGFDAIKDQEIAVRMLKTALRKGRLPHAYLFEGPDSVGKRLTAFTLAKAVNCEELLDDCCDVCRSCVRIAKGVHPDLTVIEPKKAGRIIHKDVMEDLIESASLKPFEARYRVAIILEAERMNATSANKFLKTLEEPPGNALFILVSTEPDQLLPTIVSRCQRARFHPLAPATVKEILVRERGLPEPQARVISHLAHGQMSEAFELADSEKREFVVKLIGDLSSSYDPLLIAQAFLERLKIERGQIKSALEREEVVPGTDPDEIEEQLDAQCASLFRKEVLSYFDLLRAWYRDILVFAETSNDNLLWNADSAQKVVQFAERYDRSVMKKKIETIARAEMLLEHNVGEERVFKDLFFSLAE